jgi:hypothetical protein
MIATDWTLPGRHEISEESARGNGDILGANAAMRLGTLEHEASYGRCGIGAWIVAERRQKIDENRLVFIESRVRDSALLSHPTTKGRENRPSFFRPR